MDLSLYIFPIISSLVISTAIIWLLMFLSDFFSDKRTSVRHIHKKGVLRLGGVAVVIAFVSVVFLDQNLVITKPIMGILIASLCILIMGILDDFFELSWRTQLFLQVALVVFIFIMGVRIDYVTNPWGGIIELGGQNFLLINFLVVLGWTLVLMNAMNWIDGIDGLSGGVTLIGALTIFLLTLKPEVNQPPVGIISIALAGAVLAFLVFNFNPSKIMAGTSGAMFFGFILSVLAIFAGTKIATALLVMTVPIVDAFWVIFERLRNKKSIFEPDKRHLHHKLLELGWSQRKICLFFYAITMMIAVVALNTRAMGKMVTIFLAAIILMSILYSINRKIYAKNYGGREN